MDGDSAAERRGVRARAAYVRTSAYKAREVLNLIRGRGCGEASDILAFSERDAARPISKVLSSAVSNAERNGGLIADELYVSACYADEGPTIKRWRARARGRGVRVRKRTCHITVVVSRYDEEGLERLRSARSTRLQEEATSAKSRRRRVALSRRRQASGAGLAQDAVDADSEHDASDSDDPNVPHQSGQSGEVAGDGAQADVDYPTDAEGPDSAKPDVVEAVMAADEPVEDHVDAPAVPAEDVGEAGEVSDGGVAADEVSVEERDADDADDHRGRQASEDDEFTPRSPSQGNQPRTRKGGFWPSGRKDH